MKTLYRVNIPVKELGEHKDYINHLFLNEDGVFNICRTEEDVMKSNQWFKNLPVKVYIISDNSIKEGDKFIVECANRELSEKVLTYVGKSKEGVDLVEYKDDKGKKGLSTIHLLKGAWKYEGQPTLEQLEQVVNKQTTSILI